MTYINLSWQQLISVLMIFTSIAAQDYEVSNIQCSFSRMGSGISDVITATLKRPQGFRGDPLFADDGNAVIENNRHCLIKQDPHDSEHITYQLKVTDFSSCGVSTRNGFVHVRIWFPQYPGVVMQSDQELIIMCKPPEPTIIQNKSAGFAGSFPYGARVSGVVEETPGRLEYEVALYKESPATARVTTSSTAISAITHPHSTSELNVDQAVPIGTKLQLRARISTESVWKYVKLMEVTVSPDPDNPHSNGAVILVRDGCRNPNFATIIPHQPTKYRDRPYEVFLDFEAFLLSSMKERTTLWIHSQIKACMDPNNCSPKNCEEQPSQSNHRRRRRNLMDVGKVRNDEMTLHNLNYTRFLGNIEYTVVMPNKSQIRESNKLEPNYSCGYPFAIMGMFVLLITICVCFISIVVVKPSVKSYCN